MMFSIRLLTGEVAIRLPPEAGPDPEVFDVSVSFVGSGQHYGALSYEELRSLGGGMWELPGDPAGWTKAVARRIEFDLPGPDADPDFGPAGPEGDRALERVALPSEGQ